MKKRDSLIFACLIAGIIISLGVLASLLHSKANLETTRILRVIDGDTVVVEDGRHVRLLNVNTAEKTEPGSEEAKEFTSQYINKTVKMQVTGEDKYHRSLARLYVPEYLNLALVQNGHATKFLVAPEEEKEFAKAEESAVAAELGRWEKSPLFGCVAVKINAEEELVTLTSICDSLNTKDWIIKDESRKTYHVPKRTLGEVTLHTKKGTDDQTNLYWGLTQDVWNNDRDTFYLYDADWHMIAYQSYGY